MARRHRFTVRFSDVDGVRHMVTRVSRRAHLEGSKLVLKHFRLHETCRVHGVDVLVNHRALTIVRPKRAISSTA